MTLKIEQDEVLRMALEALEEMFHSNSTKVAVEKYNTAHNALREALDHSGEANEMVIGWDRVKPEAIASDPLYQQGFVDGVEEGRNQVAEQAEQEPVAWFVQYKNRHEFVFGSKPEFIVDCVVEPLYTAPLAKQDTHATHVVRTKDLTDDEIEAINLESLRSQRTYFEHARAVIAADREKNK